MMATQHQACASVHTMHPHTSWHVQLDGLQGDHLLIVSALSEAL